MPKIRKLYCIILLSICAAGCASASYVRSDVFLNSDALNTVYVMPIASEVLLDSKVKITNTALKNQIVGSLDRAFLTLKNEFSKRGYIIQDYGKNFAQLDKGDTKDELIRQAVLQFVKPRTSESILKINEKGQGENAKSYDVGVTNFSATDYDPLVKKTLDCKAVLPPEVDSFIYLSVKSSIAPRGIFNSIGEDSTLELQLKIVGIPQEEVIFTSRQSYSKSDILAEQKMDEAVEDFMKQIPVRLISNDPA